MGRPIRVTAPTLIVDGSTTTNWARADGGAGSITAPTVTLPDGTQGARVTASSDTGGNLRLNYAPGGGISLTGFQTLDMDIHIASPIGNADVVNLNVLLPNEAGFSNYFDVASANSGGSIVLTRGWNHIRLGRLDFGTGGGSPSYASAINLLRLNFALIASKVITATISNIRKGGFSRSQICVMFDDQGTSVYNTAYPIMAARGIVGSNAVIGSYLSGSGTQGGYVRCTPTELRAMNDAGWDTCNHSWSHQQNVLTTASYSECLTEVVRCRDELMKYGLTRNNSHLLYSSPYGEWSTDYLAAARDAGCTLFRTTKNDATVGTQGPQGDGLDTTMRPLQCVSISDTTNAATVATIIDRAIASGRHLILLFHHIVTSPGSSIEYSTTNFTSIMNHLWKRSAVCDTVNFSEFRSRLLSPTT